MNFQKIPLDKIGICTSVLCIVHCLAVPVLLVFGFDSALRFIEEEWIEWVIMGAALCIGLSSFITGYKEHKQHFILFLFLAGFFLIVVGDSVHHAWTSAAISVAGASIVVYAHFQNLYQRIKRKEIA